MSYTVFKELEPVIKKLARRMKPVQDALETKYEIWLVPPEYLKYYMKAYGIAGVTDPERKRILLDVSLMLGDLFVTLMHERCHAYVCEELFMCDAHTYLDMYVKVGLHLGYTNHPEEKLCKEFEERAFPPEEEWRPSISLFQSIVFSYFVRVMELYKYDVESAKMLLREAPYGAAEIFAEQLAKVVGNCWQKHKYWLWKKIHRELEPIYERFLR